MYAFDTSAASKGRKEVFERQMSFEERQLFDPTKKDEIDNWSHIKDGQERESTLGIRWILEYRLDENANKSPEARIVMLGCLDPDYENRPADHQP